MKKGGAQNSYPTEWRVLYRAAIFSKTNSYEMAKRISDAEEAIGERMLELLHQTGADVEVEREALDDAIYALSAWRSALERRTHLVNAA